MISEELKSIIDKICQQGKMSFLDGATAEQISHFEKEHNVILPQNYKEWLQFSDGGECFLPAGVQFYGVAHKPIIDVDDDDRPDENHIVIGALASGDPILCEKSSEKISIYNLESGVIEDDEVYANFPALLIDLYNLLGIEE
jgi:hypothetical protein